jgi:hydrogenase nickel incorporation protein HypB
MVHRALHEIDLDQLDVLFIENVGNLVCPASFDLGQHANVTLLSVTEGDDKPAKYPVIFRTADRVLITKADLLPFLDDFSPARATTAIRALANSAPVYQLSAKTGDGLSSWLDWLRERRQSLAPVEPTAQAERSHTHTHQHSHG